MVELEAVGLEVGKGDSMGTLEAVKTVSDIFAPLSGTVVEINETLEAEPEQINSDPYGAGWIVKIKFSNPEDQQHLLSAEKYADLAE
jgi:glycine cleavage system H protein